MLEEFLGCDSPPTAVNAKSVSEIYLLRSTISCNCLKTFFFTIYGSVFEIVASQLAVSSFSDFEVNVDAPTVGKTVIQHARFAGFC